MKRLNFFAVLYLFCLMHIGYASAAEIDTLVSRVRPTLLWNGGDTSGASTLVDTGTATTNNGGTLTTRTPLGVVITIGGAGSTIPATTTALGVGQSGTAVLWNGLRGGICTNLSRVNANFTLFSLFKNTSASQIGTTLQGDGATIEQGDGAGSAGDVIEFVVNGVEFLGHSASIGNNGIHTAILINNAGSWYAAVDGVSLGLSSSVSGTAQTQASVGEDYVNTRNSFTGAIGTSFITNYPISVASATALDIAARTGGMLVTSAQVSSIGGQIGLLNTINVNLSKPANAATGLSFTYTGSLSGTISGTGSVAQGASICVVTLTSPINYRDVGTLTWAANLITATDSTKLLDQSANVQMPPSQILAVTNYGGGSYPANVMLFNAAPPWNKIGQYTLGTQLQYGAMHPDGVHLWAPSQSGNSIIIFNILTGTVTGTVTGLPGAGPIQVAFNSAGTIAYAIEFIGTHVSVINVTNLNIINTYNDADGVMDNLSIANDQANIFTNISNGTNANAKFLMMNASTGVFTAFVNPANNRNSPTGVLPSRDNNWLLCAYYGSNVLDVFTYPGLVSTASFGLPNSGAAGIFEVDLSRDEQKVYLPNYASPGQIMILNTNGQSFGTPNFTFSNVLTTTPGTYCSGGTFSNDGKYYFSCNFGNQVQSQSSIAVVDTTTETIVANITDPAMNGPVSCYVTPLGGVGGSVIPAKYQETITVQDSVTSAKLSGAQINFTNGPNYYSGTTDANGNAVFYMYAGSYTTAITFPLYNFAGATFTVTGSNPTQTYTMTHNP